MGIFTKTSPLKTSDKKSNFLLRISLVNVTKSVENCGFGHFTEEILNGKFHFCAAVRLSISDYFSECAGNKFANN